MWHTAGTWKTPKLAEMQYLVLVLVLEYKFPVPVLKPVPLVSVLWPILVLVPQVLVLVPQVLVLVLSTRNHTTWEYDPSFDRMPFWWQHRQGTEQVVLSGTSSYECDSIQFSDRTCLQQSTAYYEKMGDQRCQLSCLCTHLLEMQCHECVTWMKVTFVLSYVSSSK